MQPADLARYVTPSDPQLHPDGRRIAFVVTRADLDADRYERCIWMWDGETARRLTVGPGDSSPRWSPDGDTLAFLRRGDAKDAVPQLALLPTGGGEAETITEFPLGVREIAWAPDGSRLAVVGVDWTEEWQGLEDEERARRPRRIDRVGYRGDNLGWLHDRRGHIYLVDPTGSDGPRCLTEGDFDESLIFWHPDGTRVGFMSARHEDRGLDPGTGIWSVATTGGGDAEALSPVGSWSLATFSPNGDLYAIGAPDPWAFPDVFPLLRAAAGEWREVVPGLDRSLAVYSPPVSPAGPQWLDDGGFLSVLEDEGRISVVRVDAAGTVSVAVGGDRAITGVSPRSDGSAFAFVAASPVDPGELWWWEDGEERCLTSLNAGFRESVPLAAPEPLRFEHDGVTIDGWVYLPDGDDRVPLLLNVHGGPATQYGYGFFDEFQVYLAAGYGIVATNPRGSSGYGSAHLRAVVGRWAETDPPDVRDLLAAVDVALERQPRLDPQRIGVMGGSYGGLMTARLTAADRRFRSAVAERGLYSLSSFAGTSDIGPWFTRAYLGAGPVDAGDVLSGASPLIQAHRIVTPTLVLHSESDFRTPIEQGEQLFALLQSIGTPSEMMRFPGEGHEMSRSGSPRHRRERFEAILDWHGRYLRSD